MNNLQKRYRKSESVVARKVGGEFILVPIRQDAGELSSIYTLNEVAARVWELIDGDRSVEEIREKIVEEYEVASPEAEEDILRCLKQLESRKLIVSD
jgi:hypothetical protein